MFTGPLFGLGRSSPNPTHKAQRHRDRAHQDWSPFPRASASALHRAASPFNCTFSVCKCTFTLVSSATCPSRSSSICVFFWRDLRAAAVFLARLIDTMSSGSSGNTSGRGFDLFLAFTPPMEEWRPREEPRAEKGDWLGEDWLRDIAGATALFKLSCCGFRPSTAGVGVTSFTWREPLSGKRVCQFSVTSSTP